MTVYYNSLSIPSHPCISGISFPMIEGMSQGVTTLFPLWRIIRLLGQQQYPQWGSQKECPSMLLLRPPSLLWCWLSLPDLYPTLDGSDDTSAVETSVSSKADQLESIDRADANTACAVKPIPIAIMGCMIDSMHWQTSWGRLPGAHLGKALECSKHLQCLHLTNRQHAIS